ncbi:MAG: hypothetical protein PHE51_12705, partial [Eubacteriales bacterium]|nr:hypothetical protein [Eubacteriales bacterium]
MGGQRKKNKYFIDGDTVTGFTHKGEPFIFDFIDFNEIVKYAWLMDKEGYIYSNIPCGDNKHKKLRMHRLILGLKDDYSLNPDHINRQRNDNRRSNLRLVDNSVNSFNRNVGKNNKTGITGVFYREREGKSPRWVASININGKTKQVG